MKFRIGFKLNREGRLALLRVAPLFCVSAVWREEGVAVVLSGPRTPFVWGRNAWLFVFTPDRMSGLDRNAGRREYPVSVRARILDASRPRGRAARKGASDEQ